MAKLRKSRGVRPLTEPIEQMAGDISDPKRGLRAQVWVVFTILALVYAGIVTWLSGQVLRTSFREYIGASIESLSSSLAVSLDRDIFLRYRELRIISELPSLTEEDRLRGVIDQLDEAFPIYAWIGLVDPDGTVLVSTSGHLEGEDVSERPWFRRGRYEVYFGDVHEARLLADLLPRTASGASPRFVDIAIPLESGHVLAAHLDVEWAENLAERLIFTGGDSGPAQVLVVTRQGAIIAASEIDPAISPPQELLSAMTAREEGFATLAWSDGDYLTAWAGSSGFRDFPGFGWSVIVRQPTDAAYAPIANHSQSFLLWGIGLALVFGMLGWFVANRVTRPIQQLSLAARRVGAGIEKEVPLFPHRQDEVGQLAFAIHQMIRDLIERDERLIELNRELERRVQLRTADLVAANDELEAFNSMVSHDLRSPLTSMLGFLELMELDYDDALDDEGREMLATIRSSAERMNELISDHLKLSKASRVELNREWVDLTAMSRDVVARLRRTDPGRRVEVEIEEGMKVWADEPLLEIALENLIGNAWKYSAKAETAIITIRSADDPDTWAITDNGAGFDMKKVDDLFAPFKRLHSAAEFQGTGVGLSTVKRIIERHGGSIRAESTPGSGARFYVTLPGPAATP